MLPKTSTWFCSRRLRSANHGCRPACGLDLLLGRFREQVGFDRNLAGERAGAQDLDAVVHLVDDTQFDETVRSETVAFQFFQPAQVHDCVLLFEDVGEAALGQAAVNRHLAALKAALLGETGAGVLPLVPARGGFPHARAHAAPDALGAAGLPGRGFDSAEIHGWILFLTPPPGADAAPCSPCRERRGNPAAPP